MKDPDPEVRQTVVLALQLAGNPDAVSKLEPLTKDENPATREAAVGALRALGPAGP